MARRRSSAVDRHDIDQAMLRCRTYGHAWDEFFPDNLGVPMFGWRLSLRCVRCATERHDTIDHIGQVGGRRYIYPEGYQMGRDELPTRIELRVALFQNVRAKLSAAEAINDEIGAKTA